MPCSSLFLNPHIYVPPPLPLSAWLHFTHLGNPKVVDANRCCVGVAGTGETQVLAKDMAHCVGMRISATNFGGEET